MLKLGQAGLAACRRWSWWHHHGASKSRCSPSKFSEVLCFFCSSLLVVSFTIFFRIVPWCFDIGWSADIGCFDVLICFDESSSLKWGYYFNYFTSLIAFMASAALEILWLLLGIASKASSNQLRREGVPARKRSMPLLEKTIMRDTMR